MNQQSRKRDLEATQQTIRFFETILRVSADGIVITDATQNILVANDAFCAFLGCHRRDVVETSLFVWLEQLDADAPHRWVKLEQRARLEGVCRDVEFQMQSELVEGTARDRMRHLSVNASLLEQVADKEKGVIISIWHDVTKRKQTEEELRRLRDHFEESVEERTIELTKAVTEAERLNEQLQQEITERKRVEEIEHGQYALAEALRDTAEVLSSTLNVDEVLDRILANVGRVVQHDAANIHLLDENAEIGRIFRIRGYAENDLGTPALDRSYPLVDLPIYCRMIEGKQPLVIPDTQTDPDWVTFPDTHWIRSFVSAPICLAGNVIGFLNLDSASPGFFTTAHAKPLQTFANQAAIAIRNARVYEQAQQDITERLRAEQALRESEQRYKRLVESVTDYIYTVKVENGRPISTSHGPGCIAVTGYAAEEYEVDPHLWHRMVYKEDQQAVVEQAARVLLEKVVPPLEHRIVHKDNSIRWVRNTPVGRYDGGERLVAYDGLISDITERKQAEETLHERNRELALLNQLSLTFISILDLDQTLITILEALRRLLGVTACSVWLVDSNTGELVCREVTNPQGEIVRGWRLPPGEGLVGWVAQNGESLIVPDVWIDARHFKGVDQQTRLPLRSILTVPLRVKKGVIGVLQVVDIKVNRFSSADLILLEPLAVTAAVAIENAQLYRQARQDAETKTLLLQEVNHRVKNNLAAITGMLYIERRHAEQSQNRRTYQAIMGNLINRIEGLATVHQLLSASQWSPLSLNELAGQVIDSVLQTLPPEQQVFTDIPPASVRVTPNQANSLAIVINELATNVIKHALQERQTAQITVHIAQDDETILLEFRDDGPGFSKEVLHLEHQNVGMYLIQNAVRQNLRGEITLHNDNGAVVTIRFVEAVEKARSKE